MFKQIFSVALIGCAAVAVSAQEVYERPQAELTPESRNAAVAVTKTHFDEPLEGNTFVSSPYSQSLYAAKDYSLTMTIPTCADYNLIPLTLNVGKDVKAIRYMCVEGDYSDSANNYDIVAQYGDELGADEDDLGSKAFTLEVNIELTTERSTRYTILVVSLDKDENGTPQQKLKSYFYSIQDDEGNWEEKGNSYYVEDIVSNMYSAIYSTSTYLKVEQHKLTPGYYRMVNPYGSGWQYYYKNKFSHSHKHYIYIHAENPDQVYLDESPICTDLGHGGIAIASMATPGFSSGDLSAYYGKKENSVITFPQKALVLSMQNYNNGKWYRANQNGNFCVTIPNDNTAVNELEAESAETPEYYNLQGIRIEKPTQGLYIVKRGNETTKEILP